MRQRKHSRRPAVKTAASLRLITKQTPVSSIIKEVTLAGALALLPHVSKTLAKRRVREACRRAWFLKSWKVMVDPIHARWYMRVGPPARAAA